MELPINRTVAWLTWRQMFAQRRIWVAAGIALLPAVVTVLFRAVADPSAEQTGFFAVLQREIVLGTLLPLAALVFGTTAFAGEAEDGTLVYLLVKPVHRWRVVTSKYAVAALTTVLVIAPAVLVPWLLLDDAALTFGIARSLLAGVAVGAVLYTAMFVLVGLLSKRAFTLGLLYVIGFENVLSRSGAVGAKSLSIREFATSIAQSTGDAAVVLGAPAVPLDTIRNAGAVILVVTLGIAIWKLARYQLAERV